MSYILEALEKSEKERQEKTVPGLQTQHTAYPGMTRSNKGRRPARRLRPAVILALALIPSVWLLRDHLPMELEIRVSRQLPDSAQPAAPQDTQQAKAPDNTEPATNKLSESKEDKGAEENTLVGHRQPAAQMVPEEVDEAGEELIQPRRPITSSASEETVVMREEIRLQPAPILPGAEVELADGLVSLPYKDELPGDIQQQLPTLRFAGHTYAREPGQRLIIINNSISREGDLVEPGLHLKEITWDGVILDYRGISFQVRTTGP